MPGIPHITLITQGYGYVELTYDDSLLAPANIIAAWQPDFKAILLSWTDTNLTESRYGIFRSANNAEFEFLVDVPADTVAFLDTISLNNSTTYQYKLMALSDTGFGRAAYSNTLEPRNIDMFDPSGSFSGFKFTLTPEDKRFPWAFGVNPVLSEKGVSPSLTEIGFNYILTPDVVVRPHEYGFKFHVLSAEQATDPDWIKYPNGGKEL